MPFGTLWELFGSSWKLTFGQLVVLFVPSGNFWSLLEAFSRQLIRWELIASIIPLFPLTVLKFNALPVPLLRHVFLDLFWIRPVSQIHRFHLK